MWLARTVVALHDVAVILRPLLAALRALKQQRSQVRRNGCESVCTAHLLAAHRLYVLMLLVANSLCGA